MKKINLFYVLLGLLVLSVSSCKKDDDSNNQNNQNNQSNPLSQSLGGAASVPNGAAGAFYAVNNYVIGEDDYGDIDTFELGSAYAWFDSYVSTKDAGTVSVNSVEITNSFNGLALPWYYTIGNFVDFSSTSVADWSIAGNSANGITGFTHSDNTAFPKSYFTVPSSVSRSTTLNVNFTNQTTNDGVFVTIFGGNNQKITKSLAANSTSASFTAAEVQSITYSGGTLGVQVMPVKLNPVTKNGKTYYFVKQWAFARTTIAN